MDLLNTDARINLSKDGSKYLTRICKAGMKCTTYCEHRNPHITSLVCYIFYIFKLISLSNTIRIS